MLAACRPTQVIQTPQLFLPTIVVPQVTLTQTTIPTPTPSPDCKRQSGQVLHPILNTPLLPKPLQYSLYLPPCYSQTPAAKLPLLILFHGQGSSDDQWLRLGVAQTADRLIAAGEIPPLVIALPYEEYSLQDPTESSFSKGVMQALLPNLQKIYSLCTQRTCLALGGLSRGAAWAVRLGITNPAQVGFIGAHSLAPFWGEDQRLRLWIKSIPADQIPRVYQDLGKQDRYLKAALEFEASLTRYGVPHELHSFTGEHDETYWAAHIEDYLRWYGSQLSAK